MVAAPRAAFRIKSLRLIIGIISFLSDSTSYLRISPQRRTFEIKQKAEIRNQKPAASQVKVETRNQKAESTAF
jgi:hypothetical protein